MIEGKFISKVLSNNCSYKYRLELFWFIFFIEDYGKLLKAPDEIQKLWRHLLKRVNHTLYTIKTRGKDINPILILLNVYDKIKF